MKKDNFLIYSCFALLCLLLCLKAHLDFDLFWHLATGRWIFENWQIPRSEPFSSVYKGAAWIDLPWIFQTKVYFLANHFGLNSVVLYVSVFAILSMVLSWKSLQLLGEADLSSTVAFAVFLLALFPLETRWITRPEIFTTVFLCLYLHILIGLSSKKYSGNYVWLLPLIQLIWVNCHGMFILGPVVAGFFLLRDPKKMALPYLAILLACFVNPYGVDGALYPFNLKAISEDPIYRRIGEGRWLFDSSVTLNMQIMWAVWAALLAFSIKPGRRILGYFYFLYIGFCLYFSISMVRNLAPAVHMTLPFIAAGIAESLKKFDLRQEVRRLVFTFMVLILGALITMDQLQTLRGEFHFGVGIPRSSDPRPLADFLQKNNLAGHVFASPEIADFLMWQIPGYDPYIDTRFAEVVPRDHFARFLKQSVDPRIVEQESARYNLNVAIFRYSQVLFHNSVSWMARQPDWQLIYLDPFAIAFSKKGVGEGLQLSKPQVADLLQRMTTGFEQEASPGFDSAASMHQILTAGVLLGEGGLVAGLLDRALKKKDYAGFWDLSCSLSAIQLATGGQMASPENSCKQALAETGKSEHLFNLATIYLKGAQPQLAFEYFQKAQSKRPQDPEVYAGLADSLIAQNKDQSDFPEVEKNYLLALNLNPHFKNARLFLTIEYMKFHKFNEAKRLLQDGLALGPDADFEKQLELIKLAP